MKPFESMRNFIAFEKARRYVKKKMRKELKQNLFYHNWHHTEDVLHATERIGNGVGVDKEEMFLLRTAALYHDIGFVRRYKNNEEVAVDIARESLPKFKYHYNEIETISGLIMSTRLSVNPNSKLEEVICDADLDYLGRTDYLYLSDRLRKELADYDKSYDGREWIDMQIEFLSNHTYFTDVAKRLRDSGKAANLENLRRIHKLDLPD